MRICGLPLETGSGDLAALAAAAALVHIQVVADGVDVFQGGEDVAGKHHRPQRLGDFAVAYHIGLAGGEGEHFHAGRAAVPVLGVNAFFDIGDHIVKR